MVTKKAYTFLFDGYADWEIGYLLAELRRLGQVDVITCSISGEPVISMGGLKVTPDISLSKASPEDMLIFVLPGGYLWEQAYPEDLVHSFLQKLARAKVPVAAICAATTVLAKAGLLKGKKHTSNSILYLEKMVPGYAGHQDYQDSNAVADGQVITASGLGAVEFTMTVLESLNIASSQVRTMWYDAFKNGVYPEHVPGHD